MSSGRRMSLITARNTRVCRISRAWATVAAVSTSRPSRSRRELVEREQSGSSSTTSTLLACTAAVPGTSGLGGIHGDGHSTSRHFHRCPAHSRGIIASNTLQWRSSCRRKSIRRRRVTFAELSGKSYNPRPCPPAACGMEGLERVGLDVQRDPGAPSLATDSDAQAPSSLVAERDAHAARLRAGVADGVVQQVDEHAAQVVGVEHDAHLDARQQHLQAARACPGSGLRCAPTRCRCSRSRRSRRACATAPASPAPPPSRRRRCGAGGRCCPS